MAKRPSETGPSISKADLTWEAYQSVLASIELTGANYKSCEINGFSYSTVRSAINKQASLGDLEWEEAWNTAHAKYRESLVQEARRRAVDGWNEPIYHMGKVVGTVEKRSDRLLELMLIKQVPEFAAKSEVTIRDERPGGGLDIFKELTLDAKKRIRDIIVADLQAQRAKAAEQQEIVTSARLLDGPEVEA